jgi:hypothetical protein
VSFGGDTYNEERDGDRLRKQLRRVRRVMADEHWRTLDQIAAQTGDPPQSVSARLRDFRKDKFGAHTVERHWEGDGLWSYRVIWND